MPTKLIRVLLVDDHPVVLRGIAAAFSKTETIDVVGEAHDAVLALRKAKEVRPDVVLMDLEMPHMGGLSLAERFKNDCPGTKVIILTMHDRSECVMRAIQAGARGYVLKTQPAAELISAVERVHQGGTYFNGDMAMLAVAQFVKTQAGEGSNDLSCREREVLLQIAEGLSNKEIACLLGVGTRTIETHRERIMRKLNIHSVAGLTRYAIARGYIVISHAKAAIF